MPSQGPFYFDKDPDPALAVIWGHIRIHNCTVACAMSSMNFHNLFNYPDPAFYLDMALDPLLKVMDPVLGLEKDH